MQTETASEHRKCDELASMLEHLAGVLTEQADRLAALDERLDRQDEKVKGLIELTSKQAEVQTAQQRNMDLLAIAQSDSQKLQAAVEAALVEHKNAIEKLATAMKEAFSAPRPLRTVN